jgi:VIT1/CCC1 family predicted Fe2+/Mn2+ transporter
MGFYRRATILRLAPLEGAALMAVTFTLITDKLTLLLIALFLVGMMWMARPTQTAFAEWRG